MTVVFPDVLNDVRYWLRRHPDLAPITGGAVFFRIPTTPSSWPLQRIYRLGGGVRPGTDAPIQDVLVSIECWHNQDSGYQALRQLVAATESAVWTLPSAARINPSGQTLVTDAAVTNAIDSPDPDTGYPRYVLDTRFTVITATTQ
jgi:hypothetical protein